MDRALTEPLMVSSKNSPCKAYANLTDRIFTSCHHLLWLSISHWGKTLSEKKTPPKSVLLKKPKDTRICYYLRKKIWTLCCIRH